MTPLPERPAYGGLGDEPLRAPDAVEADRPPVALAASAPARIAALRGLGPDRAAALMAGLQRGSGNAAVARMLAAARPGPGTLARKFGSGGYPLTGVGDAKYSKVWYGWSARWTVSGKPGDTQAIVKSDESFAGKLKVKAGTRGTVRLAMVAHFLVDLGDSSQQFHLSSECSWNVDVGRQGEVKAGNPLPPIWSLPLRKPSYSSSEDPYVVQGPPGVAANESARSFSLAPVFQIRQKGSETTVVGPSANLDFKGFGLNSGSRDTTKTIAPPAGSFSSTPLTITLEPDDIAGPKVELGEARIFNHAPHRVQFHREANTDVSADERQKVMAWYTSLSPLTQRRLKVGTQQIRMDAYASNTGKASTNQHKYAQGRANAVKSILGRFVADAAWTSTVWGEDKKPDEKAGDASPAEDRPGHERVDPSRLVVDLKVLDEVTAGARDEDEAGLLPRE